MNHYIVKIVSALGLAFLVYFIGMPACSPVQFGTLKLDCRDFPANFECTEKKPILNISNPEIPDTNHETTKNYLEFNYSVSLGKVDIIFVVDNSSSMAKEHRSFARQFKNFLNKIKNVQYHIAVITTDISASPYNPVRNAYYQDGKFIPIARQMFLTNKYLGETPPQHTIAALTTAISREETIECDTGTGNQSQSSNNIYDQLYEGDPENVACPSHDERGTYAMNLAIRNPQYRTFFRDNAHLMFIVLSDEDIRSSSDFINQDGFEQYTFEDLDYPETLVRNIHDQFGSLKSFSVHSIIIPPGDSRCLNKQNRNNADGAGSGRGYYGEQYARLSKAREEELIQYGNLLRGSVISICDKTYGSQLKNIAVATEAIRMPLPCNNPESIEFYINERRVKKPYFEIEALTLIIEPGKLPLNAKIKLKIICEE